ncbi:DctP family TRAP transporter solute-binding subunit [Lachnospiraceae bacterium 62-35]
MKNMKKFLALGLTFAMAASLAACGGSSKSSSDSAQASGSAAKSGGGDNIKLSLFAGSIPENTPTGGALKVMADYINENSDGTLTATAFYDTALGDATSMVQGLQQGTVDIGVSGTAYFSGLVPEVEVFQLPFLFSDLEQARAAVEGPAKDAIFEKLSQSGIIGLAFWENGFRELSNNVRPIKTPDDMQGIKMRTLPAEVQVKTWEAMGALPATIDASELYTALQQGTVSAQDNPLHEIASRKFYEVQPYITLTDAVYTPFLMAMSETTWNKLSDAQKEVIMEAAKVGKEEQLRLTDEAQASAKQTLIDNGCTIEEAPDKEAFKEKAMPTWSLFTDQYGTELVDMIQKNQ